MCVFWYEHLSFVISCHVCQLAMVCSEIVEVVICMVAEVVA